MIRMNIHKDIIKLKKELLHAEKRCRELEHERDLAIEDVKNLSIYFNSPCSKCYYHEHFDRDACFACEYTGIAGGNWRWNGYTGIERS